MLPVRLPVSAILDYADRAVNTSNVVLSQVINGTGAPGIYNSSVTPAGSYGEYNWCNMPHVVRCLSYQPDCQSVRG